MKVGIIGLGNVAEVHLEAYINSKSFKVISGSELNPDRLKEMSEKYHFTPYLDYKEMLAIEALDIVCILTPVSTHPEIIEYCAKQSFHILCEKPIAVDMEGANRIIKVCKDENVKLFYGSTYRFLPALITAKEQIKNGAIGEVQYLTEEYLGGAGLDNYEPMGFSHYPKGGIGGSGMGLVDHGIHLIDIFPWLMNSPITSVFGRGNISGNEPQTEFMHMTFKNGAMGHLAFNEGTFSADLPHEGMFGWGGAWSQEGYILPGEWQKHPGCIKIYGSKGALRIFHYVNELFLTNQDGTKRIPVMNRPTPENFTMQMEEFVKNITERKKPSTSGEEGVKALEALLAVYESFDLKKAVNIP